jgi:diacylglycerol kinase (ATP)
MALPDLCSGRVYQQFLSQDVSAMRLLLLFNSNAGNGRARRHLPGIRGALSDFAEVEVLHTRQRRDALERLAARNLEGVDGVISAGGDGTLFEAVNGLYRNPGSARPTLGVIPIGTGNAFARDMGLKPGDWRSAVRLIRRGGQRAIDVGRVECPDGVFHFLNIIGAGLPAEAMRLAAPLKFLGNAAYTVSALWQVMRLKSRPVNFTINGRKELQDIVFIEIANTRYTGTTFLIAPQASFEDGLLDVVTLRRLPRTRLLRLFPTIYRGTHVNEPEVTVVRAERIEIHSPEGMPLAPDGELYGSTPATIVCLPGDQRIYG